MHKERILEIAELLESPQAENHFNMTKWIMHKRGNSAINSVDKALFEHHYKVINSPIKDAINDCGTVACIAGWTAVQAKPNMIMCEDGAILRIATKYLGLTTKQADQLFIPMNYWYVNDIDRDGFSSITPKEAAQVLRHVAETGKVDWTIIPCVVPHRV